MQRLEVIRKFFVALASTVVLFVGGMAVPPLGVVLLPLVPQPALGFGLKYGIGWGLSVSLIAAALLIVFAAEALAVTYGLFALIAGLLFGLLGRQRTIESLVATVTAAVFSIVGSVLFYAYGSWSAMMSDFREGFDAQLAAALRIHEKIGLPKETVDLLRDRGPHVIEAMLQLLPGLIFVGLAVVVLFNILLLCRRFPERRSEWLSLDNLREWKAPEPLVWLLIACGFALFVPGIAGLKAFAANFLVVIAACYFAQGLAIVSFFFNKNHVPRFLRGVTYVLIFFQQIFTLLVVGLGLFDLWGNFRKLGKNDLNPSRAS